MARTLLPPIPMREVSVRLIGGTRAMAIVFGSVVVVAAFAAGSQRVTPLAATLEDFNARVKEYVKLTNRVAGKIGHIPETSNPALVTQRQQALRDGIRQERANAKQGDVFTPPIADAFRRFIEEDFEHRPHAERRALVRSVPTIAVHVDDAYPPAVPLATVPPRLLEELPKIPDKLQYRFLGSCLILYDIDADLVVDVLPDAIPERYRKH